MNFFKAIITIWHREVIRYFRDKTRIATSLFQPLMFLAVFGSGLRQMLAGGNFGVDFIQFMYPGILAIGVMGVAFFSAISTVFDREFGFLKEILVAPVPRSSIALGKALGASTIASAQALILLIVAPLVHVQLSFFVLPQLILFLLLLAFSISGIGLLIASLMKSTESFGLVMQVLIFPMFFVSGAFFPLTSVPAWLSVAASINPLTYGVDALRIILLRNQAPAETFKHLTLHSLYFDAFFLIIFSALMITVAVWAFNRKN